MTEIISHIGFSSETGGGDLSTLEASLRRIAASGAEMAELSLYAFDLISGGRVIEGRAKALADICGRFPLRYSVHGQIISNAMDPDHASLQSAVVRAMLELCERVGAGILVQHGGTVPMAPRSRLAEHDKRERDALHGLAEVARGHGVRIALENIFAMTDGEYRRTPSEVAETVKAVGHPNLVGLVDFSHAYIEATRLGIDWRAEVRTLAKVAGHLHVHDSFGRPYTMTRFYHPSEAVALGIGDLHLPLGWGDIPWELIFDEIEVLPGTAVIMEIGARYHPEWAESLERSRGLVARLNGRSAAAAA